MKGSVFDFKGGDGGLFVGMKISFNRGDVLAMTGPNASGKTYLCSIIAGEVPCPPECDFELAGDYEESVAFVSFSQQQAEAQKQGWLQARYYEDDDAQTVDAFLSFNAVYDVNPYAIGAYSRKERKAFAQRKAKVIRLLSLSALLKSSFVSLSNGETRRVLLARALVKGPKLLVLDDPCAGLDPARREKLKDILDALVSRGMSIVMTYRHDDELPDCVTKRIELGTMGGAHGVRALPNVCNGRAVAPRPPIPQDNAPVLFSLKNVSITFGKRRLFKDFSWTVRKGERWVLRGENGSGKTTLLSLVIGDNPLAYSFDITVFGKKREVGESLWRIRKRIGMVSPEQQSYFNGSLTLLSAVLSGRMNEDGMIARSTRVHREEALKLLGEFGFDRERSQENFENLSSGEQRLVLMARALVSHPDLLLLDEPCMNLDAPNTRLFLRTMDAYLLQHPSLTAVCVAHRQDDVPAAFTNTLTLS